MRAPNALTVNFTYAGAGPTNVPMGPRNIVTTLSCTLFGPRLPLAALRAGPLTSRAAVQDPAHRTAGRQVVVSDDDAVSAANEATTDIASQWALWRGPTLDQNGAPIPPPEHTAPTNPAEVVLAGVTGAITISVEMPTVLVALPAGFGGGLGAGAVVTVNATVVHTWLNAVPATVALSLEQAGSALSAPLACSGAATTVFPHVASSAPKVDSALCTVAIPSTLAA